MTGHCSELDADMGRLDMQVGGSVVGVNVSRDSVQPGRGGQGVSPIHVGE
jgi:hypothetical protein